MQTKPRMMISPEMLNGYWPQIEPLLATAPIAEDIPTDRIRQAVMDGEMQIFVFENTENIVPEVELVMVLAPTPSVLNPGMTIVAIAGKNFKKHIDGFWEDFKGWCKMNGARAIDAYVPERMEGLVGKLGFNRKSIHVRLSL